ncbi:DUF3558 domain-containing protein [Amycolatopsis cihanbeyliensis]|uniref:Uncharacterized protein DUF3558 n=1 Tax=Amycolatopsis cihanbeyliensis TaxID=1128664 RepID=A0A542DK34_AMYCI|nr:DUF3558 domain-containing protein [Amycolatopsis cihanbeyliensis]TQJ03295.1 uncharacterized protein DUF3558 [Amycolatopsis cihanbeyliensis]
MRRATSLLVTLTLGAILASCSDQGAGTPTIAPTATSQVSSGTSATTGAPANGAPKVEVPLDISRFQQAPCEVLTSEQVTMIFNAEVSPTSDVNGPSGPACSWSAGLPTRASVSVIFPKVYEGLGAIYGNKNNSAYFQPLDPIQGYPVVASNKLVDDRNAGACRLNVGTSDTTTANVNIQLSEDKVGKKDPCQAAHDIATMVISTIKGAQ